MAVKPSPDERARTMVLIATLRLRLLSTGLCGIFSVCEGSHHAVGVGLLQANERTRLAQCDIAAVLEVSEGAAERLHLEQVPAATRIAGGELDGLPCTRVGMRA